jgi:uncharacterized protein (TIGR00730 family)
MASRGLDLVYGGGHIGLMGIVAGEVLAGGREVTGVITEHLFDREVAHHGLTELVVAADMPARKEAMFRRGDAFVALPGGVGTMEELFEVLCWRGLGLHPKPVGLLNVDGYYDHLVAFLDRAMADDFLREQHLVVDDDVERLLDGLLTARAVRPDRCRYA